MTKRMWPPDKIARLGYLVGTGLGSLDIASELDTSQNAVLLACSRMGLRFTGQRDGSAIVPLVLLRKNIEVLDAAARARGIDRQTFLRRLVETLLTEGLDFIDNVMDDDVRTPAT